MLCLPVERDGCDTDGGDEHVGSGEHRNELTHKVAEVPHRHGNL